MKEMITKIVERWFLGEPALFTIYCNQHLRENHEMRCMVRCGKGFVEYNPTLLEKEKVSEEQLEELMRTEMIRLFLKHPYQRQPENALPEALTLGSDMVLAQNYRLNFKGTLLPFMFQLPNKQCFEWYVNKLDGLLRQPFQIENQESEEDKTENVGCGFAQESETDLEDNGTNDKGDGEGDGNGENASSDEGENGDGAAQGNGGGGKNPERREQGGQSSGTLSDQQRRALADQSGLWEEDELRQQEINEIIRDTTQWGTIPGNMVEQILASLVVKMDYRKVLSAFHTSILTSRRKLTRMKPNRRSGFAQMGSRYDLASKLLVAVVVSGSISTQTLTAFYSAIARFFKYGVETIDVVQFDVELREVTTFEKRPREVKVFGRGGTNFQPIFDHLKTHPDYDGCIIFTDGYADEPHVDFLLKSKVLWVCRSEKNITSTPNGCGKQEKHVGLNFRNYNYGYTEIIKQFFEEQQNHAHFVVFGIH